MSSPTAAASAVESTAATTSASSTSTSTSTTTAAELKEKANQLFSKSDFKEAIKIYTQAIDSCSNSNSSREQLLPVLYSNISQCHIELKDFASAKTAAELSIRCKQDFFRSWQRLGAAFRGLRLFDMSVMAYQKSLMLAKQTEQPATVEFLASTLKTVQELKAETASSSSSSSSSATAAASSGTTSQQQEQQRTVDHHQHQHQHLSATQNEAKDGAFLSMLLFPSYSVFVAGSQNEKQEITSQIEINKKLVASIPQAKDFWKLSQEEILQKIINQSCSKGEGQEEEEKGEGGKKEKEEKQEDEASIPTGGGENNEKNNNNNKKLEYILKRRKDLLDERWNNLRSLPDHIIGALLSPNRNNFGEGPAREVEQFVTEDFIRELTSLSLRSEMSVGIFCTVVMALSNLVPSLTQQYAWRLLFRPLVAGGCFIHSPLGAWTWTNTLRFLLQGKKLQALPKEFCEEIKDAIAHVSKHLGNEMVTRVGAHAIRRSDVAFDLLLIVFEMISSSATSHPAFASKKAVAFFSRIADFASAVRLRTSEQLQRQYGLPASFAGSLVELWVDIVSLLCLSSHQKTEIHEFCRNQKFLNSLEKMRKLMIQKQMIKSTRFSDLFMAVDAVVGAVLDESEKGDCKNPLMVKWESRVEVLDEEEDD